MRISHICGERKEEIIISIKSKRIEAGLTQSELAQVLKVDQSAISLWEAGIGPKRNRLVEIAQVLDCTVGDLLDTQ